MVLLVLYLIVFYTALLYVLVSKRHQITIKAELMNLIKAIVFFLLSPILLPFALIADALKDKLNLD